MYTTNSLKILLSVILVSFSLCGTGPGKCKVQPTPSVVQNFNPANYMGKWYEQFRDKDFKFSSGECGTAEYALTGSNTFSVNNSELRQGQSQRSVAEAKGKCPSSEAKCSVNFGPDFLEHIDIALGKYWVLRTDYENYAIVYSCSEIFSFYHSEYLWILTREKNPSQEAIEMYYDLAVNGIGYPANDLRRQTIQGGDCIY